MLRRMSGPKRPTGENFTMRCFMIFRLLFKLLRLIFFFFGGGGHVALTGKTRIKNVSRKTLQWRENLEDMNNDRRIILKWSLHKWDRRMVTRFTCFETYHYNWCKGSFKHSGSIRCGEYLEWLRNHQLLRKECSYLGCRKLKSQRLY